MEKRRDLKVDKSRLFIKFTRLDEHFFSWTLIYSIAIWVVNYILEKYSFSGSIPSIFLAGIIILTLSYISQKILYRSSIHINKYSLLWFFLHSFTYWMMNLLVSYVPKTDTFVYFIVFGLGYNIITWIFKHKLFANTHMSFLKIFIVSLLIFGFLYYLAPLNLEESDNKQEKILEEKKMGTYLSKKANKFIDSFKPEPRDVSLIEIEILRLVNKEREKNSVDPLSMKDNLRNYARDWSENMISKNIFEHSNLGFSFNSYAGENIGLTPIHSNVIGCGSTYSNEAIAECMTEGWITSADHHANMINTRFSTTGIGIACDSSKCKGTQVFQG